MLKSFQSWLEEARQWPLSSEHWAAEEAKEFLQEFSALATARTESRHALTLAVQTCLDRLGRDCSEVLDYLAWKSETSAWNAASCPIEQAKLCAELLGRLIVELDALGGHWTAQPSNGGPFSKMHEWFAEMNHRVDAVTQLRRDISQLFVLDTPQPGVEASSGCPTGEIAAVRPLETFPCDADLEESPIPAEITVSAPHSAAVQATETDLDLTAPAVLESECILASGSLPEASPANLTEPVIAPHIASQTALEQETLIPTAGAETPESDGDLRWIERMIAEIAADTTDREVAVMMKAGPTALTSDSPEEDIDLRDRMPAVLWDRVHQDDLPGAYWLARALEADQVPAPISSGSIAAIVALRWYSSRPELLVDHIHSVLERDQPQGIAGRTAVLGSALQMALFAPSITQIAGTVFQMVLHEESAEAELSPLLEAARSYSKFGVPLRRVNLAAISDEQDKQRALASASSAMAIWLAEAPRRRTRMAASSEVWKIWTQGPRGRIYDAAQTVLQNRTEDVQSISKAIELWSDPDWVEQALNTDADRVSDIDGGALKQIWGYTAEFAELLGNWCDAVGYGSPELDDRWHQAEIRKLRDRLRACGGRVVQVIQRLKSAEREEERAAAAHFHREVASIYQFLLLDFPPAPAGWPGPAESWYLESDSSMETCLLRRLELVPGLRLEQLDDVVPRLQAIGLALIASISHADPADSLRQCLEHQDFRWSDLYLDAIGQSGERLKLHDMVSQQRAAAVKLLEQEIERTRSIVQGAGINTWISNSAAEAYLRELEHILPRDVLVFGPELAKVRQIGHECNSARVRRLTQICLRWRSLYDDFRQLPKVDPELSGQVNELVRRTLESRSVRPAEALLNEIAHINDNRDAAETRLANLLGLARARRPGILERFLELETTISEWLEENSDIWLALEEDPRYLPNRIRQGRHIGGLLAPSSKQERRDEAATALDNWMELRQIQFGQPDADREAQTRVAGILSFLGFDFKQFQETGPLTPHPDRLFLVADMSAAGQSPLPAFGSGAGDRYHVLVLRRNPGVQQIQGHLAALPRRKEPLLLLFVDHLRPEARRQLGAYTKAHAEPILALDDIMMLFLTQCEDLRLRPFFQSALPFSGDNPYTDQRDGPVAPEMFYGLKGAIEKLMARSGTCFICGGRQLGKSALQNYIQKQFDRKTPDCHVWCLNIKEVFNPRERRSVETLWAMLRKEFQDRKLISSNLTALTPTAVMEQLKQVFEKQPTLEVTVFLDEADDLLETMMTDRRRTWALLTTLMDQTERRFKVIFAGNYHISRFVGLRNQSATVAGQPIEIGPMEFPDATDLILAPLDILGYRFTETTAVLNILSHTHRHASLLQLFLHELLAAKMRTTAESGPPYDITPQDVEAVCRLDSVRQRMWDRIEMTLRLDPEYRALTYAMLLDQEDSADFRSFYDVSDLRRKAEALWPRGFRSLTNADTEARLEEMCTLGILVRRGESFRLGGPHLMGLFGDFSKIKADVEDLAGEDPRPKFDESSAHGWIGSAPGRYSPLTLVQERLLQQQQTQTRLIFISAASGLPDLVEGFEGLLHPSERPVSTAIDRRIPSDIRGRNEMQEWLGEYWHQQGPGVHRLLFQLIEARRPEEMLGTIAAAQTYCRRLARNRQSTLRVFFVFTPAAGWRWLQINPKSRIAVEESAAGVIWASRWDAAGIRCRLEDLGRLYTSEATEKVMTATSGWHFLLHRVFEQWSRREEGPDEACRRLSGQLASTSDGIASEFRDALGLISDSFPGTVLRDLIDYNETVTYDQLLELCGRRAETVAAIEFLRRYGLISIDERDGSRWIGADPLVAQYVAKVGQLKTHVVL